MLAGASRAFAAAPYSEVTTAGLAECCEASEGLIFHYFGSKAGLYAAVVGEAIDRLGRAQTEAVELLGVQGRHRGEGAGGHRAHGVPDREGLAHQRAHAQRAGNRGPDDR